MFFLFKQKTAYEMRISDWSSDVCSSDLEGCRGEQPCNLGWPANDIRPVANTEFLEENPAVRALLESVQIPIADIFAQNAQMNAGEDSPEDLQQQAEAWLQEHQSEVDEWLSAARKIGRAHV